MPYVFYTKYYPLHWSMNVSNTLCSCKTTWKPCGFLFTWKPMICNVQDWKFLLAAGAVPKRYTNVVPKNCTPSQQHIIHLSLFCLENILICPQRGNSWTSMVCLGNLWTDMYLHCHFISVRVKEPCACLQSHRPASLQALVFVSEGLFFLSQAAVVRLSPRQVVRPDRQGSRWESASSPSNSPRCESLRLLSMLTGRLLGALEWPEVSHRVTQRRARGVMGNVTLSSCYPSEWFWMRLLERSLTGDQGCSRHRLGGVRVQIELSLNRVRFKTTTGGGVENKSRPKPRGSWEGKMESRPRPRGLDADLDSTETISRLQPCSQSSR